MKANKYVEPPDTRGTDKFIGYCAVTPNRKFMKLFKRANIQNVLISYHYIRKDPVYTAEILEIVRKRGGLFMTDSGAFSFFNDKSFNPDTFDWESYVEEYVKWLKDNKDYIFSACNLDVDAYVGHQTVVRWNREHFEPLEKDMNIIYVAHPNAKGGGELDVLKEYCKKYDYVAVNEGMAKNVSAIYTMAKQTKTAIHGLAWTKPTILKDFPFFSVDSSSWVNYQKYGATPVWDGKNFSQYDKDNKAIRRTLRNQCVKYGVKEYEFVNEKNQADGTHNDDEGLTFSLRTWLDVFQDLKRYARTKLSIDVRKKVAGKSVIFMEDQTQEPIKNRRGGITKGIDAAIKDFDTLPATKTTYSVDKAGNEVATYEKRDTRISIADFIEKSGDVMVCNHCHVADKCPKFKEDNTCAFDFAPGKFLESPLATIDMLLRVQTERVQRAVLIEKMEGGMPNKVFATELKLLNDLNNTKTNMLMLMQGKGLRITQTTVEMGGGNSDRPKEVGFAELLKGMLAK